MHETSCIHPVWHWHYVSVLFPWYNPFNNHVTQYDLDVTSICLVFWGDFMWIIYETSFWKLDHRVDTTETSMMKPTFQVEVSRNSRHWIPPRRPTKTGKLKLTFGWNMISNMAEIVTSNSKIQWNDLGENDLGDFLSIYIYISCFFWKSDLFLHFYT